MTGWHPHCVSALCIHLLTLPNVHALLYLLDTAMMQQLPDATPHVNVCYVSCKLLCFGGVEMECRACLVSSVAAVRLSTWAVHP